MHRFFTTDIQQNHAFIHGDDVKHIVKVLRLKVGDAIQICDGAGRECEAHIAMIDHDIVQADTGVWTNCSSEPNTKITLFQCLPKAGKMETIIQKCVELGACAFTPVQSERCVVVLKPPYAGRIERWQRVSEEAAKQSRRGVIPMVAVPVSLEDLCFGSFDAAYVAYENEKTVSLKGALRTSQSARTLAIIIGPEGGFSDREISLLESKGVKSVSLGPRILRTETAGMAMLAQILYEVEL